MTDAALLAALLAHTGLQVHERRAFSEMADRGYALSFNQRTWAQGVGARLKLPGVADPGRTIEIAPAASAQGFTTKRIAIVEAQARMASAEIKAHRRARRAKR